MRTPRYIFVALLVLTSCASGDSASVPDATIGGSTDATVSGTVDATVGSVDAMVGTVDAMVGTVDAMVGTVDATVGSVDASAGTVDAMVGGVDAMVGSVDAMVGSVDAMVDAMLPDAAVPPADASIIDAAPPADAPIGANCTLSLPAFNQPVAVAIVDNTTVTSTIAVTGVDPYLWDVKVHTNITHTYNGDLGIVLISPAGTRVEMSRRRGGTNDNVFNGTVWNDAAATPVVDYTFSDGLPATPVAVEGALAQLAGEDPNGVWTLEVTDNAASDSGSIDAWSLVFSAGTTPVATTASHSSTAPVAIPDNGTVMANLVVAGAGTQICDVNLTTNITHTYSGDLDLVLVSPSGTRTVLVTDNSAGTAANVFNGSLWDDDTGTIIGDMSFSDGVTASPLLAEGALGAFVTENPNGTWTLEVSDTEAVDTGTIDAWSLSITTCDCP